MRCALWYCCFLKLLLNRGRIALPGIEEIRRTPTFLEDTGGPPVPLLCRSEEVSFSSLASGFWSLSSLSIRYLLGGFFFFLIGVAVEAVGEDEEGGGPEADEDAEEFTVGAEFEGGGASAL